MLNPILPAVADQNYRGFKTALWLLGVLLLLKLGMGVGCTFNGYETASTADGIPLNTFPPAAAQTVVYLMAAWGIGQLALAAIGWIVLIRYRSLVPLMFALQLFEMLGRKAAHLFIPVVRVGTPPGYFVNLFLIALMLVGLALSLWRVPERRK